MRERLLESQYLTSFIRKEVVPFPEMTVSLGLEKGERITSSCLGKMHGRSPIQALVQVG
jgi:hypothetical protein